MKKLWWILLLALGLSSCKVLAILEPRQTLIIFHYNCNTPINVVPYIDKDLPEVAFAAHSSYTVQVDAGTHVVAAWAPDINVQWNALTVKMDTGGTFGFIMGCP